MARIGLTNIWFSNLTEAQDGTATYDGAKNHGKAVSTNFAPNTSDAALYGDDAIAESDTVANGGTLTLGVTDDDDTVFAPLLGHTITDGEVVYTTEDVAPYVGIGYILTKVVNNDRKYKVDFFNKVKFSEIAYDQNTKGESIEYTTPTIEGNIAVLADGSWRKSQTFDSLSDALTYLKGLMAAPTP
jgi:phi13 family phage major tail protein